MFGPVIEGERVRLEPPRVVDAATFQRWFADMEVTRYLMHRNPPTLRRRGPLARPLGGRDPEGRVGGQTGKDLMKRPARRTICEVAARDWSQIEPERFRARS